MSKLRNSSVQRNIDPTDQLISAETIQFPAMEEELGGVQYTVHTDTELKKGSTRPGSGLLRSHHGDVVV